MTFFAKIAKRLLKSSSKQEPPTVLAPFAEISLNEYGPRPLQYSQSLCQNTQEAPLEQQEDAKKLIGQPLKSCPDQPDVLPPDQKRSSLPNDEWMCIDCGEKERLYIIIGKERPDTNELLEDDIVACETCGFRMFGSTMNSWFYNREKQNQRNIKRKRKGSKTKE